MVTLLAIAALLTLHPPCFAVNVAGQGRPAILIPGLMDGHAVWDTTVAHLASRYTCYTLTLPGFAGQPPIQLPSLETVRKDIEAFVVERKLNAPVLIGHGLGGMLALWLAADRPDLYGGVVSVDGVPALAYLLNADESANAVVGAATAVKSYYQAMNAKQLADTVEATLPAMVTAPADRTRVAAEAERSDPVTVGEFASEQLLADLRPRMRDITIPVQVFAPGGAATDPTQTEALRRRYEAEFHAVPQHAITVVPNSKHFIMLDAPKAFFEALDEFLERLILRQ